MAQHRYEVHPGASRVAFASANWRKSSHSGNDGNCVEAAVLGQARWHKSSYSGDQGNCVETVALGRARWHKSSYSGSQGNCLEVAGGLPDVVAVRDSKNPDSPALVFGRDEWTPFIGQLRHGEPGRS